MDKQCGRIWCVPWWKQWSIDITIYSNVQIQTTLVSIVDGYDVIVCTMTMYNIYSWVNEAVLHVQWYVYARYNTRLTTKSGSVSQSSSSAALVTVFTFSPARHILTRQKPQSNCYSSDHPARHTPNAHNKSMTLLWFNGRVASLFFPLS
jgi:hypothetical protein